MQEISSFGEFLKALIQAAGMTQHQFYTALGIKKPYFYDILSGRTNPPPSELQFRAVKILQADEKTKKRFFDLAARERGEIPADIAEWIAEDPHAVKRIRNEMKQTKKRYKQGG